MSEYVNHTAREAERKAPSERQMQYARHVLEMLLNGDVDRFELYKRGKDIKFKPIHEGKPESA